MTYVITTTWPDRDRGYEPAGEKRHTAATVGESRLYAMREVLAMMDAGHYDGSGAFMQDAATHPEAGATIGPLPDGTTITIELTMREPIHGDDLARPDDMPAVPMAGDRW